MPFLTKEELNQIGLKFCGKNVRVSDKASIHNPENITIGDNSRVDDFCVISGKVTLGRNVHIAVFCNLAGGEKGITMEDFSGLAYACQIFTQSDDYSGRTLTNPTVPDFYKNEIKNAVTIGRHSIVGTNSVVFPGVTLAEGTSVGALSVVTKNTEEWSVYVGHPAKRVKARHRDLLEQEAEYMLSEKS